MTLRMVVLVHPLPLCLRRQHSQSSPSDAVLRTCTLRDFLRSFLLVTSWALWAPRRTPLWRSCHTETSFSAQNFLTFQLSLLIPSLQLLNFIKISNLFNSTIWTPLGLTSSYSKTNHFSSSPSSILISISLVLNPFLKAFTLSALAIIIIFKYFGLCALEIWAI